MLAATLLLLVLSPPAQAADGCFYLLDKGGTDIWPGLAVKREFINIGSDIGDVGHELCLVPPLADWMTDATQGRLPPAKADAEYTSQYHAAYSAAQVQDQYLQLVDRILYQAGETGKGIDALRNLWLDRCQRQTPAPFSGMFESCGRYRGDAAAAMVRTLKEFYLSGKASEGLTRRAISAVFQLPRPEASRFIPEIETILSERRSGPAALTEAIRVLSALRPDPATGRLAGRFIDEKNEALALAAYEAIERIVGKGNGQALKSLALPVYSRGEDYPEKSRLRIAALAAFRAYPEDIRCEISPCIKAAQKRLKAVGELSIRATSSVSPEASRASSGKAFEGGGNKTGGTDSAPRAGGTATGGQIRQEASQTDQTQKEYLKDPPPPPIK